MQEALHTDVEVDRRRAGIDQPDRDVLRLVTQSIPLQEAERLTRVFGDVPVDALAAVDAWHMFAFELVDRGWSIIPPLLYGRGIEPAQNQREIGPFQRPERHSILSRGLVARLLYTARH